MVRELLQMFCDIWFAVQGFPGRGCRGEEPLIMDCGYETAMRLSFGTAASEGERPRLSSAAAEGEPVHIHLPFCETNLTAVI